MNHTLLIGAVNQLLKRQPHVTELLIPHAGKGVCFKLADRNVSLFFAVASDGLLVADDGIVPDVTFTHVGTWPGLPLRLENLLSQMEISGNVELADVLSRAMQRLDINPGDWLPEGLGDVVSQRVTQAVQAIPTLASAVAPHVQAGLSKLPKPPHFLREQLNELLWLGEKLKDKLTRH